MYITKQEASYFIYKLTTCILSPPFLKGMLKIAAVVDIRTVHVQHAYTILILSLYNKIIRYSRSVDLSSENKPNHL